MPRDPWLCHKCNIQTTQNLSRVCTSCLDMGLVADEKPPGKGPRKKKPVQDIEEYPSMPRVYTIRS